MESIPGYVSIVFILTTFAAVAFLLQAAKRVGLQTAPSRILLFLLPLWIFFQAILGVGGFYQLNSSFPPRIALFGVLPAVLLIVVFLVFFRGTFVEKLPLKHLTLIHIVRIPVEMVLYWLFLGGSVPREMTFAGWNFDILSGFLALIAYLLAFRAEKVNDRLLIGFNLVGLALLVNIVAIAILALPTPMQQLAFEQPNRAVLFFPFNWLPSIVVPIVLFSHLASLWQLLGKRQ